MTENGHSQSSDVNATELQLFDLEEARALRKKIATRKRMQQNSNNDTTTNITSENVEIRDFESNHEKALHKLQAVTDRDDIAVERTEGGLVFKLNTGSYLLFKNAVHKYFTRDSQTHACALIPVFDKKGLQVETKYKVSSGKTNFYTANLYHTRCSCLVNGKKEDIFLSVDLPKIIVL